MHPAIATSETLRIAQSPDVCGDKPCINGTRIRALDIYVLYELQGKSPDQIVDEFPQLSMSDVFAALTYLWDHRQAIVQSLRDEEHTADNLRARFPSKLSATLSEQSVTPISP